MKINRLMLAAALSCAAFSAGASWYWPFGGDDSDKKPLRLHQLLENANDLIEQAEDASLEGDAEKALDLYNSALTNLTDIAKKNPDRADTPEFAPLRNKIAATSAAIDSIRFEQVNRNIRAVAVTDTTELQKKYDEEQARKKGIPLKKKTAARRKTPATPDTSAKKSPAPPKKEKTAPAAADKPAPAKKPVLAKKPAQQQKLHTVPSAQMSAPPKPRQTQKPSSTETAVKKAPPAQIQPAAEKPDVAKTDPDPRVRKAMEKLNSKDYAAADLILEEVEKERPKDLNVLTLRSAAQSGLKYYLAARRTLEKAMRAHPRNYIPCYNLAYLMFKIENEGKESAKQYYELGRALGGPQDERLERLLQ